MAKKKVRYCRDFVGKNLNPIDPHSPNNISDENEKIKDKVIEKFSGYKTIESFNREIYHGFDGKQQYHFQFYEESWDKKRTEFPKYFSIIEITKTGNKKEKGFFPSDLEKFIEEDKEIKFKKLD